MISTVNTFKFISEAKTKNAPVQFLCNDMNLYHAKYIQAENEYDCLVYEWFCNRLAHLVGIPVPEIALVKITNASFQPEDFRNGGNRLYIKPECVCFGTLEIGPHDMLNQQFRIRTKTQFLQYSNSYDLVKTAIFDMHTANRDRWEENFNLLIKRTDRKKLIAIDHYDTFGGLHQLARFEPNLPADINATVIRSEFFFSLLKFMDLQIILDTIDEYVYLCQTPAIQLVSNEIFEQVPESWQLSAGLKKRMESLLMNEERLLNIAEKVKAFILFNKSIRS